MIWCLVIAGLVGYGAGGVMGATFGHYGWFACGVFLALTFMGLGYFWKAGVEAHECP